MTTLSSPPHDETQRKLYHLSIVSFLSLFYFRYCFANIDTRKHEHTHAHAHRDTVPVRAAVLLRSCSSVYVVRIVHVLVYIQSIRNTMRPCQKLCFSLSFWCKHTHHCTAIYIEKAANSIRKNSFIEFKIKYFSHQLFVRDF